MSCTRHIMARESGSETRMERSGFCLLGSWLLAGQPLPQERRESPDRKPSQIWLIHSVVCNDSTILFALSLTRARRESSRVAAADLLVPHVQARNRTVRTSPLNGGSGEAQTRAKANVKEQGTNYT